MNTKRRKYIKRAKSRPKKKTPLRERLCAGIVSTLAVLGIGFYYLCREIKAGWLWLLPFVLYFVSSVGKGIFVSFDPTVLAFKDYGIFPILSNITLLAFLAFFVARSIITKKKKRIGKKVQKGKTKLERYFLVAFAGISFVVSLLAFFPRQVLYSDRIEKFGVFNQPTESISLLSAHIEHITFEKHSGRSTYYTLSVTLKGNDFRRTFKIEPDKLLVLYNSISPKEKPRVLGAEYCKPYLNSHKKLSDQEKEFLCQLAGGK